MTRSVDVREQAVVFDCAGESLLGIISHPAQAQSRCGVLILVGGPQYRVGAHRQFVHLARALAAHGIPAMRFDFRGMGDSGGSERTFRYVTPDIEAAISAFQQHAGLEEGVVLWGLCGGASAACLYGEADPRVSAVMLVNPWLTAQAAQARVRLKHYYVQRLLDPAFWRKVLGGRFKLGASLSSLFATAREARGGAASDAPPSSVAAASGQTEALVNSASEPDLTLPYAGRDDPLPGRMLAALEARGPRAVVMLSGRDYVAKTFEDCLMGTDAFKTLVKRHGVEIQRFPADDHTFSDPEARQRIERATVEWVLRLAPHTGRRVENGPVS